MIIFETTSSKILFMLHVQTYRLAICALALMAIACQEEPEYGGFVETTGTGSEGSGKQSVTINLGAATTLSTTITYRVGGNAALDGDYHLTSLTSYYTDAALTITVPAGKSVATIDFEIIDDIQVESNEVIYFEITSISDESIASNFKQASYVFQIEDNDEPASDGLQIDLSWNLGDGIRINNSNFNLYLANAITVDTDGSVTAYEAVDGVVSANDTGFETIVISKDLPDHQYFVIIDYVSGNDTAEVQVELSNTQTHRVASGRVSSASIGHKLYLGPITKTGSTFEFR